MSRLSDAFTGGKAFVAFVTCGDPDLETTRRVVLAAAENGADVVELGIPFSDPTAEGPVIQAANARALAGGVTTERILELASQLRRQTPVPLVFMTYANVVYSYGCDRFMSRSSAAGVDGVILPDVPFEEKQEFAPAARRYGVPLISLVAPTSGERAAAIAKEAEGFLYVVSSLGVTGERKTIATDLSPLMATIRRNTALPCAVGFGISTPEQAAAMGRLADGVIVGSAIVRLVEQYGKDAPAAVGDYVKAMKQALLA